MPELMQQFRQVADVPTMETLKLPVPEIETVKPIIVRAPATAELKEFVASLAKRAEALHNGRVDPSEDNMLKITTEGRKAALDLGMMNPRAPDHPTARYIALWTKSSRYAYPLCSSRYFSWGPPRVPASAPSSAPR